MFRNEVAKVFVHDTEGISPIIGTILLVAIVVIMAGLVSRYQIISPSIEPRVYVIKESQVGAPKNIDIKVSGIEPPLTRVTRITASFYNASGTLVQRTILGDGAPNRSGFYNPTIHVNDVVTGYDVIPTRVGIGDNATIVTRDSGESVTLVAYFSDGHATVISRFESSS